MNAHYEQRKEGVSPEGVPGSESGVEPSFVNSETQEIQHDFLLTPFCRSSQGLPPLFVGVSSTFRGWGKGVGCPEIRGLAARSVCIIGLH